MKSYDSTTQVIPIGQALVSAPPPPPTCLGLPSVITATGNSVSYVWDQGVGTGQTHNVTPTVTTTYTVTGTDAVGCTDTAQAIVHVDPGPAVNAGPDDTTCAGDTVVLTAQNADFFSWSTGDMVAQILVFPQVTTSYIVTGSNPMGCSQNDTVVVFVEPLPVLFPGPGTEICQGDSIQIGVSGNAVSYTWDQGLGSGLVHTVSPMVSTTRIMGGTRRDSASVSSHRQAPIRTAASSSPVSQLGSSTSVTMARSGESGHNASPGVAARESHGPGSSRA